MWVWSRSALPKPKVLTCTLTGLQPVEYETPFLVRVLLLLFCTRTTSVSDPVSCHLTLLLGVGSPNWVCDFCGGQASKWFEICLIHGKGETLEDDYRMVGLWCPDH